MTTEEFLITMNNNTKNNKYLSKLERTHNKAIKRINDINLLKKLYYNKYLIKEENIPNYQNKRIIITTQQKSLETWGRTLSWISGKSLIQIILNS